MSSSRYASIPDDPSARRQRLAVLCALDRARLRLVLAPTPRAPVQALVPGGLDVRTLLDLTRLLPGKLGVWSRRLGLVAGVFRLFR